MKCIYSHSLLTSALMKSLHSVKQWSKRINLILLTAMEKEVKDHASHGHWTIVDCTTLLQNAKPIKAIWSFKRKQRPDGTFLKHKAHLCAHGEMQQWSNICWKTYSPVIIMLSVLLLLSIAEIYKLDSKAKRLCPCLSTNRSWCGHTMDVPPCWFPGRWSYQS